MAVILTGCNEEAKVESPLATELVATETEPMIESPIVEKEETLTSDETITTDEVPPVPESEETEFEETDLKGDESEFEGDESEFEGSTGSTGDSP